MNCPRCHASIPADGPQGLCPKCLLSVALGEPEIVVTDSGEPAPPPPTPAELQPHFPQLEILRLVGRGGMGAVYEARQKGLARSVALKILAAPKSADASFEERFVREAQALARLSHENIVAVFDAGRAGPHFFLSMEYVDGPNLRQAERAGHIEPAQALAIVMQICTALDYAHKNGIVHRDIKPENVLLTREGRVKIVDFGLAKVLDRAARGLSLTRMSQTMGTPHYMAPEQIEHPKDVDHRADIYSLGVVFYELLTGELPLGRFPLPSQKVQIDVRLDDIVIRTLEKEPERRYQAASEVGTAVQGVASSPLQTVTLVPARRRSWVSLAWALAIIAAILFLLALASFVFLVLSGKQVETSRETAVHRPAPELALNTRPATETDPARLVEASKRSSENTPPRSKDADADLSGGLSSIGSRLTALFKEIESVLRRADARDRVRALDVVMTLTCLGRSFPGLEEYLEHEASRTTFLPLSSANEVAALRIDPDFTVVTELRTKFRERLEEPGSNDLSPRPEDVDWLVREHMPFDEGPVEVHIALDGSHWAVRLTLPPRSDLTPAHSASKLARQTSRTFSDLPVAYRRMVARQRDSLGSQAPAWPDGRNPLVREFAPIPDAPRGARVPDDLRRVWNAAREELMTTGVTILEEYWRAESQCTSNRKPGGDHEVANVHIDAFPATRYVLAEAIWRCLGLDGFRKEDIALLRENEFALAVLPFGDQAYDVSIEGLEEGWKATTRAENGLSSTTFGMPELQEPFARLLRRFRSATTEPR